MLDRLNLYLQWGQKQEPYTNTDDEQALVQRFATLFSLSKSAHEAHEEVNPTNLDKWRRAYKGTLNALKQDGTESTKKARQLRKTIYELIESKVDNSIPMPKLKARYKSDLDLIDVTESYLKYEVDKILTKYVNDRSERATYIDGTSWYKVSWDSMDNSYTRAGSPKIDICLADQIIPQPGILDYKQLEYIFEIRDLSISKIYDLYGKLISPINAATNVITVVSCYYLNENHIVGHFMWAKHSEQVICNEKDWQIRKLRKCTKCGKIEPRADTCGSCGNKTFKYKNAEKEILTEDLYEIYNPYDVGETDNDNQRDKFEQRIFLTKGTEIPFYNVRQLPFVPRPSISSIDTIYGMSEVGISLDMQDAINKILSKGVDKTLKSGAIVTKPEKIKIGDTDDTFKTVNVRTAEEAAMVQTKQIVADTQQDIVMAQLLYESARSSSGVTDSYQGKRDTTATSGKAKELQATLTAGRLESLRVMKAAAFAGLYELVLKYLLAFSDEPRKFMKVLPDGGEKEMTWNKYMFLDKTKDGQIYYRDDLSFDSDPAATLSQSRVQMWQETTEKFIQGALGNPADPRTLKVYWNIMASFQYPLAKVALAGIKDNEQHIPVEIEQALMANPELMQQIIAMLENPSGQGGARPNSGPAGNGATQAANVERTNERNRASTKSTSVSPQQAVGGTL